MQQTLTFNKENTFNFASPVQQTFAFNKENTFNFASPVQQILAPKSALEFQVELIDYFTGCRDSIYEAGAAETAAERSIAHRAAFYNIKTT